MLDEAEIERIRNKYFYLGRRFRQSISYLMSCPEFLNARDRLREAGYLDWQIFDAAIQAIGRFRMNPEELYSISAPARGFDTHAEQSIRYLFTYFEFGDEPVPPCERWSVSELKFAIQSIGMAWLSRRRLMPKKRGPYAIDEIDALLRRHDFFAADPKPPDFPVQP